MPTSPVVDQEFIVHLFAPLDGPRTTQAYAQIRRIWTACHDQLGMSGRDTAGLPSAALPTLEEIRSSGTDSVLAFQESRGDIRQAVLRRSHDVLNLSVALAQPAPEGRAGRAPGRRTLIRPADAPSPTRLGWKDYAALWARASQPQAGALLGEAHVYLARTQPGKSDVVQASAGLSESLESLLPYREDRSNGWHRHGITTTDGYALWDTAVADTRVVREIVLVAAADRDEELSAWAWSDRSPAMPTFARYLMHAAKLRYEARLLDSWRRSPAERPDADSLVNDLNAVLAIGQPGGEDSAALESLRTRLRDERHRLNELDAGLASLEQTVSVARQNLAAQPGCGPADGTVGMFAADQSLARYVDGQIGSDRRYLQIELGRVQSVHELATAELARPAEHGTQTAAARRGSGYGAPTAPADVARNVFVVYGRDTPLVRGFFDLLYAVGLQPLEWERLVALTETAAPPLADVVRTAPRHAQANLVLLSPDDIVELHPDLVQPSDLAHERDRAMQARPNVLFELGLAYMANPERTVIVEIGQLRPIADLGGLNRINFDGSYMAIKKVIDRLILTGCPVDISGGHWLDTTRFAGLEAYGRGPGTGAARTRSG